MQETAAAAATAVSFPEDIVREILVRVEDAGDLFRCAAACRRWGRLVAKASFLRRRWPEPCTSTFLSGFFTPKRLTLTDPAATMSLISTPGCAIFTGADDRSSNGPSPLLSKSIFSKLVIIETDYCDRPLKILAFTSSEASWSTVREFPFPFANTEIGPIMHLNAVVCRGTADWLVRLSGLHTLDVDVETCHVSMTEVTNKNILRKKTHDKPQLSVNAGGTLSLLHLQRQGLLLDIYTRQDNKESHDGGDARWLCTFLELQLPKHIVQSEAQAMYLSFLGAKGGVLLFKDSHRHFYAADLKTGVVQELVDCGRISRAKVVPFEIEWPSFFSSQLGSK